MNQTRNAPSRPAIPRLLLVAILVCLYSAIAYQLAEPRTIGLIFGIYSMKSFTILTLLTYLLVWASVIVLSSARRLNILRCVTMTASIVFIGFIVEVPAVCGAFDYRGWITNNSAAINRFDPFRDSTKRIDDELVTVRKPYLALHGTTVGNLTGSMGIRKPKRYEVDATYDHHGFRNSTDFTRADIAVVGDSFIESGLVAAGDLITARLAKLGNASVVNLGQCGYGPQQELAVTRRYALPLRPKFVVWSFFEGNDIKNVNDYKWMMTTWATTVKLHNGAMERSFYKNVLRNLVDWTAPKSLAYEIQGASRMGRLTTVDGVQERMFFGYRAEPTNIKNGDRAWRTAKDTLLEADQLCQAQGARLIIMYIPTKFRVYRDYCEFSEQAECREWIVDQFPKEFAAWAAEKAIPFLDLTTPFREAAGNGHLLFYPDDTHWNDHGNILAADELSRFIHCLEDPAVEVAAKHF